MNSIIDEYLLFISNTISSYSKVLLQNDENIEKEKLTDIIYDYLNEVFLLDREVGNIKFNEILKIKLNSNQNSLFNLFVLYGLTDRIKLKDKSIKSSYAFLVDAINYFINVQKYIYKNANFFYDQVFQSIMKNITFIDKVKLRNELKKNQDEIVELITKNLNVFKELDEQVKSFSCEVKKVSNDMHLVRVSYNNEEIYDYNEQEVDFVLKEYEKEIYLNSVENFSRIVIKELFEGKKNRYFIFVPEYIVKSKSSMNKLLKIFSLYSVNKKICLMFSSNDFKKLHDIDECFKGYKLGVYINEFDTSDENLDSVDYMIVDYCEDHNKIITKYSKRCTIIINGKLNSQTKAKLKGKNIEYFSNIKVIS